MRIDAQCEKIELLLSDVDGVLTDGSVVYTNEGIEIKRFHIRDGMGIRIWQRAGYRFGLLTARSSNVVKVRAAEMGVEIVRQGFEDKLAETTRIADSLGLDLSQVAYIGDDLIDLQAVKAVGVGVAVADGVEEVRTAADYVTKAPGGRGAVRETIEMVLKAKHRWETVISRFA